MSLHQEPSEQPRERRPRRKLGAVIALAVFVLAGVATAIVACSTGPETGAPELTGSVQQADDTPSYTTSGGLQFGDSYYTDGTCTTNEHCDSTSAEGAANCAYNVSPFWPHASYSTSCPFPANWGANSGYPPGTLLCATSPAPLECGTGVSGKNTYYCWNIYQCSNYQGKDCPSGQLDDSQHCTGVANPFGQSMAQTDQEPMLGAMCPISNPAMCAPNANLMLASLNLSDTPVGYAPQKGPNVFVRLTYNHLEGSLPATIPFFNIGPNWTVRFLSYITDDPGSGKEGTSVSRYVMSGGSVVYDAEAGAYNSTTGLWPAELQGAAVLKRSPATGTLTGYTLTLADGSVQTFSVVDGATAYPRRVFLTSIADPQGNALTLNYNTTTGADGGATNTCSSSPGCRLNSITDAEGRSTSFSYVTTSGHTLLISSITDPFGRSATLSYDSSWRLSSIQDVLGITSSFTYDAVPGADAGADAGSGGGDPTFIKKLTTPYGDSLFAGGVDYTAKSRWLTLTDPAGNTQRVEFDSTLPSGVDAGAAPSVPTGINFDATTLTSNNTFVWDKHAYATDGAGSLSYADARQHHWLLSATHTVSPVLGAMKQPKENFVFYNYPGQTTGNYGTVGTFAEPSAVGRILDDSTSQVSSFTYNASGFPLTTTDPLGRALKYTYGNGNNIDLTKVERQISSTPTYSTLAQFTYNTSSAPLHVPLTAVDAAGQTTKIAYNSAGQVLYASDALNETRFWEYDSDARVTRATVPYAVAFTSVTYGTTNLLAATDTSYSYLSGCDTSDPSHINCDAPQTVTDSEGRAVSYTRDALDRVTTVTYPDATTDSYDWTFQSGTYSGTPSLEVRKYTDRLGRAVTYSFDAARRLTSMVEPTSGSSTRTTSYAYDHDETLQSQTDPNGNVTAWAVDIQSRPTSKTFGSGTGSAETESYAYETTTSRLKTVTDPLSEVKTHAYDKADELTGITYTSTVNTTSNVTFAYDTWFPRRTSMTDGIGTTAWSYVAVGTNGALQLLTEDGPFSGTMDSVTYTYDALGRESARTISGGNESLSYDTLGRVSTHGTTLGSFSYGYNGQTAAPTSRSVTNSSVTVSTAWTYDSNVNDRRLTSITNKIGTTTVRGYTYSWGTTNDAGVSSNPYDITGIAETAGAGGTWAAQSWTYAYDKRDRLTSASTGSPTSWSFSFTRDNADNITAATRNAGPGGWSSFTPNVLNQRTGTGAPTYDSNGNITNDYSSYKQKFDAENRMVEADFLTSAGSSTVTGQEAQFQYDGLGRRIVETEIATNGSTSYILRFLWCGDEICQTRYWNGSTETVTRRYYPEGEHFLDTSKEYVRMPDQLGSVRDSVDAIAGTVAFSIDYGPEGEVTRTNGSAYPDHRYAGMFNRGPYIDHLTRYRIQNPNLVSWDSRDPIGEAGGMNLYGYVGGNPVSHRDPKGLCPSYATCPDETQPGWVYSGGFCHDGMCLAVSTNSAGYWYGNAGFGTEGPTASAVYTNDMQQYCSGATGQVGGGIAAGGNGDAVGIGFQWPPGIGVAYGVPLIDAVPIYGYIDWLTHQEVVIGPDPSDLF